MAVKPLLISREQESPPGQGRAAEDGESSHSRCLCGAALAGGKKHLCRAQEHAAAAAPAGSGIICSSFDGEEMNLSSQLPLMLTHPEVQAQHLLLCLWG